MTTYAQWLRANAREAAARRAAGLPAKEGQAAALEKFQERARRDPALKKGFDAEVRQMSGNLGPKVLSAKSGGGRTTGGERITGSVKITSQSGGVTTTPTTQSYPQGVETVQRAEMIQAPAGAYIPSNRAQFIKQSELRGSGTKTFERTTFIRDPYYKSKKKKIIEATGEKIKGFGEFIQKPSSERREKTISYLEKKTEKGGEFLLRGIFPTTGKRIVREAKEVYEMKGEPTLTEKYGARKISSAVIYGTTQGIVKMPLLPLKLQQKVLDSNIKDAKGNFKQGIEEFKTSLKEKPITTVGTIALSTYLTGKIFKGASRVGKGVKSKSVSRAVLPKKAEKVLMKVTKQKTPIIKGEQYYGFKESITKQTRKVIASAPEKQFTRLETAGLYRVLKPKPTVAVSRGKNTFSVNVGGTQYTTQIFKPKIGKTQYVRSVVKPSGKATIKIYKGEKLLGQYKKTIKPTIKFAEPVIKTQTKQFISAPELRKEITTRTAISRTAKVRKSDTYPFGVMKTVTKERLKVKTISPKITKKYGKPVIDLDKGTVTPQTTYIKVGKTRYRFVDYPTKKAPTKIYRYSTGETLIERKATSLTEQLYKPKTEFKILLDVGKVKKTPTYTLRKTPTYLKEGLTNTQLKTNIKNLYKQSKIDAKLSASATKSKIITQQPIIETGRTTGTRVLKTISNRLKSKAPTVETVYIQRPKSISPISPKLNYYRLAPTTTDSSKYFAYPIFPRTQKQVIKPDLKIKPPTTSILPKVSTKPIIRIKQIDKQEPIQIPMQRRTPSSRSRTRTDNKQIERQIQRQIQSAKQTQQQQQLQKQISTKKTIKPIVNMPFMGEPYIPPINIPMIIPMKPTEKQPFIFYKQRKDYKTRYTPTQLGIQLFRSRGEKIRRAPKIAIASGIRLPVSGSYKGDIFGSKILLGTTKKGKKKKIKKGKYSISDVFAV